MRCVVCKMDLYNHSFFASHASGETHTFQEDAPPASAPETVLPCPEPVNCAAGGKCGEDVATPSGQPICHECDFARGPHVHNADGSVQAPPPSGELPHGNLAHGGCPACNALIAALRAEVEFERDAKERAVSQLKYANAEVERLKATREPYGTLLAHARARADVAIAERDTLQRRLDDSRSLQEGTATLLGAAIAERDVLSRIVKQAVCELENINSNRGTRVEVAAALKATARAKEGP